MGLSMFQSKFVRRGDGLHVNATGGNVLVVEQGGYKKVALLNRNGQSIANPVAPTNGSIEFYTLDTIKTVDLYMMLPTGHFLVKKSVTRSLPNEFWFDEQNPYQVAQIPFHIDNYTAATEGNTGIQFVAGTQVLAAGAGVLVTAADATETIDVGLLSTESGGDADGFMALLDVGTTGFIRAGWTISTSWPSATTIGALLRDFTAGTGTDDRGSLLLKPHLVNATARSVSLTLTTGSDTAVGLIVLPYIVPPLSMG